MMYLRFSFTLINSNKINVNLQRGELFDFRSIELGLVDKVN